MKCTKRVSSYGCKRVRPASRAGERGDASSRERHRIIDLLNTEKLTGVAESIRLDALEHKSRLNESITLPEA